MAFLEGYKEEEVKAIYFKEVNLTLTGRGEVKRLFAYRNKELIMSCWKMSLKERLSALIFGKTWLSVLGHNHPPVSLVCEKDGFEKNKWKKIDEEEG